MKSNLLIFLVTEEAHPELLKMVIHIDKNLSTLLEKVNNMKSKFTEMEKKLDEIQNLQNSCIQAGLGGAMNVELNLVKERLESHGFKLPIQDLQNFLLFEEKIKDPEAIIFRQDLVSLYF